jgi:hypothetical protein
LRNDVLFNGVGGLTENCDLVEMQL